MKTAVFCYFCRARQNQNALVSEFMVSESYFVKCLTMMRTYLEESPTKSKTDFVKQTSTVDFENVKTSNTVIRSKNAAY